MALNENIPIEIDKPQIKARIATLITKVRLLDLFIHLKNIPEQKQREIFIQSLKSPQEVIGAFAAYLIRDYDLQYEMMEIHSSDEQINYLYRLFESNELTV